MHSKDLLNERSQEVYEIYFDFCKKDLFEGEWVIYCGPENAVPLELWICF